MGQAQVRTRETGAEWRGCVGRMKIHIRAGQLDLVLFGQLIEQPAGATEHLVVNQAKPQTILIGGVGQLKTGLDRQVLSEAPGPGRIGRPLVPLCKAQNQTGGQQFTHQGVVTGEPAGKAQQILLGFIP